MPSEPEEGYVSAEETTNVSWITTRFTYFSDCMFEGKWEEGEKCRQRQPRPHTALVAWH